MMSYVQLRYAKLLFGWTGSDVRVYRNPHSVGFFEDSILIGSWVMPLYREVFGINYTLRTLDIDFAVKFVQPDRERKVDLEKLITDLGYLPVIMQSGILGEVGEMMTLCQSSSGILLLLPFLLLISFSASLSLLILVISR